MRDSPQLQELRQPAPAKLAPPALPVEIAAGPAAPEQGPFTPSESKALQSWQKQIVALLERNKRYPLAAQARGQKGVAQVFFSLDRQGRVVESRIIRSSGAALCFPRSPNFSTITLSGIAGAAPISAAVIHRSGRYEAVASSPARLTRRPADSAAPR